MKKQRFCTLAFLLLSYSVYSQPLEKKLEQWDQTNPIQKLYLQLDHETYFAGQTIWFKAYFLSGHVPSFKSSTLYVELLNNQSQLVIRKIFPSVEGQAVGQLELPLDFVSGSYQLRAYSPLMLNQPDFLFTRRITVIGQEPISKISAPTSVSPPNKTDSVTIHFFPEGGNLLVGLDNHVAFKVTNGSGYPLHTVVELRNSRGELIMSLETLHDGMGLFLLNPAPGESYYATISGGGKPFYLPPVVSEGVFFTISPYSDKKIFALQQVGQNSDFEPAYMIGQMQHRVVFRQNLGSREKAIRGVLQTKELLSGILQVTVFNKDGMPLAERATFVDNKDYLIPTEWAIDSSRGATPTEHAYTLKLLDSLTGNFSVSVTNADYEPERRPSNILAHFLLTSDIKGYVHNPSWYFLSDADSVKEALDLVMMTNGWSRFKWEEIAAGKPLPSVHKDPGFIRLNGLIQIKGTQKPLVDRNIALILSATDTLVKKRDPLRIVRTDALGRFRLDSMVFFGETNMFLSDMQEGKKKWIKAMLNDSLWAPVALPALSLPFNSGNPADLAKGNYPGAYKLWEKAKGATLTPVVVKASRKTPKQIVEERYVQNPLFKGSLDTQSLDLVNEEPNGQGMDILHYLNTNLTGWRNGRYKFYDAPKYYLNENELFDIELFRNIPMSAVAYVKVIGGYMGTGTCALVVYTKQGADLSQAMETGTDILHYKGYSIIKEFYDAANEEKACESVKPDNWFTFQWKPDVFVSAKNPAIPIQFCKNTLSQNIKVVVEGVTEEGRLLMFEKTIVNDPK